MSADFVDTTIGGQLLLQRGFDITKKQQKPGNIPVVSSGGSASYHNKAMVSGPGVVLGRKGSLGTVFYIKEDFWPHDTTLWVKDFKGNNPRFVYYFFKSIAESLKKMDVGAANPALNRNHVHPLPVKWPVNGVQDSIVEILGAFDDKVELNRQINQTLEQIAQAIFKSWFVNFEPVKAKIKAKKVGQDPERAAMCAISGKTDAEIDNLRPDQLAKLRPIAALFPDVFEESELGMIPKGWDVLSLKDCKLEIESGKRPKGGIDKSLKHGIPSVGAESISPIGEFDYSKVKYVSDDFALKSKKGWVRNLDVALYKDGGKPGLFKPRISLYGNSFPFKKFMINEHVFLLRSELLGPYFLFYTVSSTYVLDQLIAKGSAKAAQPGLNQNEVKTTKFLFPGKDIIKAFNLLLEPNVSKQLSNGLENQILSELRDTLIPKLLSDEIKLSPMI